MYAELIRFLDKRITDPEDRRTLVECAEVLRYLPDEFTVPERRALRELAVPFADDPDYQQRWNP